MSVAPGRVDQGDPVAGSEPSPRLADDPPQAVRAGLDKQALPMSARLGPAADQTGGNDPRVVDHQAVGPAESRSGRGCACVPANCSGDRPPSAGHRCGKSPATGQSGPWADRSRSWPARTSLDHCRAIVAAASRKGRGGTGRDKQYRVPSTEYGVRSTKEPGRRSRSILRRLHTAKAVPPLVGRVDPAIIGGADYNGASYGFC